MTVLTSGKRLASFLAERLHAGGDQADRVDDCAIDRDHLEALVDTLWGIYHVERIELQRDQLASMGTKPVRSTAGAVIPRTDLISTFRLPYTGDSELWNTVPDGDLMVFGVTNPLGPVEVGGSDHLLIRIPATGKQQWEVQNDREQVLSSLIAKVEWVNQQVDKFNETLRTDVRERLMRRVEMAEHGASLDATSDVPLYRAPAEEQVPIQVERKDLRLIPPDADIAGTAGSADPVMGQEIYEDVVRTIEHMTLAMERTPTAAKLEEEEIRNLILFVLNANYRGAAAGEVFNGEGKTDILLRWGDANAFIGECKFWKGPKAFREAIDQMLGYVSWRDTKAALILFMRGGAPTEIVEKAKAELRRHEAFKSERPNGTDTHGDFVLTSPRDGERLISVALIGVVIPELKKSASST